MRKEKIEVCRELCFEFIKRADAFLESSKPRKTEWKGDIYYSEDYSPKHSGALRRMSMELTRALADMRRS